MNGLSANAFGIREIKNMSSAIPIKAKTTNEDLIWFIEVLNKLYFISNCLLKRVVYVKSYASDFWHLCDGQE